MAVIRTISIAPGANTGWHYHPALVQAVLLSGELTRVLEDGTVEVTRPGQFLIELPQQVHIGYNHGSEPVVILANYQVAEGCPLAVPAPAPVLPETLVPEPTQAAMPGCRRGQTEWLSNA
ncbi:cupin domain-containing protein [Kitasatospora sp. GAS204B]|uniref:cupin domain-containing protein n=1 Tax=unclassified Kitasatospora TaxID=2633591 RepID=UPI0024750E93|nr:cupin domain-containing protein [Kitasatospora sp. GAS204B]MDH6123016.1 oxalate decarboxylase/phosphoglucose isomerase-like protein (cupin superfamily) [Kitasatospora sp. GAS204B]